MIGDIPKPTEIKKKGKTFRGSLFYVLIAFLVGLGIGFGQGLHADGRSFFGLNSPLSDSLSVNGISPPKDLTDVDFKQFWQVWNDIKEHYYKQPVSNKELFQGALNGLAGAVKDPYTNYFPPEDAKAFEDDLKGSFSGIGAEIGVKDNELQVIAPLPDSPAEKAGVHARDLILQIDGKDSIHMPAEEAVMKIRGEKGTKVTLKLGRVSKDVKTGDQTMDPIEVTIVRDTIVIKSVKLTDQGKGIFQISISSFDEQVTDSFYSAVDEAMSKGAKGIIVDVRNDPGGYLDRAARILGAWLPKQDVVLQRKQGEIIQRYQGEGNGILKDVPTVVLINEGSASASEILAGALQDYGVATIVGKTSFGKGSVQDYLQYDDGSALKITISEWLTPKERSINEKGITPDISVDITHEDITVNKDPQLDKAIQILTASTTRAQK
ncbi:MAG: S41 family peptidase [Patescibacteria group bacterium]